TSNESSKGSISRSSEYIPGHPLNAAYKRSFQRMETYRVGIIFRNDKMQSSSVKWSCDLKMPFWGDTSIGVPFTQNVSGITYANLLGLKVKLKDGVMPDEASSWQVVIAPRRQEDKSVVFNGILQTPGTREIDGVDVLYPESDATSADSSLYTLSTVADVYLTAGGDRGNTPIIISPDINYRDDIEYKSGDFIQGAFKLEYNITSSTYNTNSSDAAQTIYHKLGGVESLTTVANKKDLIDFSIIPQNADSSAYSFINGIQYNNYAYGQGGDVVGLHGTVGVGRTSSTLALSGSTATTDEVPMISYRRNNFNLQYGGIDYYSRQRTEYIAIGEVKYNDNTSVSIFEGDTYIDYFWYLKQSRDVNELNKSYYCTLMFPVESSICPSLDYTRVDRIEAITSETGTFMTESMGAYTGSVGGDDYTFDQTFNLYQYNFSYSVGSFGEYYYDVLLDQSNQTYFPNRIRNSEVKQPGEIEDSFTIFKANNYKDVDGRYGPINNIESFKNKLFFWQDSAFGIAAVNDRSLVQDSSASTLALGSGGILDRIDYISESVGNQNEYGIVLTNKFLYWIDNINNGIYKYSGAEQTLSKTKGIQSWINKNGHIGWGIGEYDQKYNHVLFTFSFSRKLSDVIDLFLVDGYIEYFETISEDSTLDKDGTEYEIVADSVYGDQKIYSKNNTLTYDVANSRWGLGKEIDGDTDSEIYVTIKGDPDKTHTIVFDERNDSFIGFESFEPRVYVKGDGLYMTSVDRSKLYSHGTGKANKGQFYGTYYPSIVTTVFNKDYPHTKVFDTIKWTSESVDSDGKNQFLDTFDEVEFWNDYQHTGDRTLYYQHDAAPATRPTPISRRERTWSMNVPRSIIAEDVDLNPDIFDETNWDSTQTFKERIRDKHLVAKFTYTNDSDDNTFSVPFVSAQYRKSFR
ncbi:MAG TPA: hypothetical protein VJ907_00835, partial [Halanaerobiales bacterium]|nr:hypothetical protein [Halanaerobiales bacterium]